MNQGVEVAKIVETKTISVKGVPEDLWRQIRSEAVKNGLNTGEYITLIIREYFSKLMKKSA